MLIVCPNCATSYMIDQAAVGPAGRTVRCVRCRASWFAGGPEPEAATVAKTVPADAQPATATRAETPPQPATAATAPAADADKQGATQSESVTATEGKSPPIAPRAEPDAPAATAPVAPPVPPATEAQKPEARAGHDHRCAAAGAAARTRAGGGRTRIRGRAAASFDARRKRMQARRKQSRRSSRWTAAILVLIAVNVTLIGARNEVVRYLPQTASLFAAIGLPVNLRNLKFENVKLSAETADGISLLIVQGAIVGETGKPVAVPRLRFALRNATGQEVYNWTMVPPRSILDPGERLQFRSQIPAPQVDATDVMVRFFTPQDVGAK